MRRCGSWIAVAVHAVSKPDGSSELHKINRQVTYGSAEDLNFHTVLHCLNEIRTIDIYRLPLNLIITACTGIMNCRALKFQG